jgi:tRNA pseudouridine55 synthase
MDGILVVNKPKGWTSHDVVDFVRKRFGVKKAGHAGTLDPMATGVLVMLLGNFTKRSGLLMADDKEYEGTLILGAESDTGDADGKITPSGRGTDFSKETISSAFDKFTGTIEQRPPAYSAVKIKGRKLYELARKGITADPKPRHVTIKKLEIIDMALPEISFRAVCSKGTYIRQLAADIGKSLGCGAYLVSLNRTRSGKFDLGRAADMETLRNLNAAELESRLTE